MIIMEKGQGALELLIIIAAVLGLSVVVMTFLAESGQTVTETAEMNECRVALSNVYNEQNLFGTASTSTVDACSAACATFGTTYCTGGVSSDIINEFMASGTMPEGSCGDGVCSGDEDDWSCPDDCMAVEGEVCGDGICSGFEGITRCFEDCVGGVRCPNGIVEGKEECDDGNFVDDDGCTSSCKSNMQEITFSFKIEECGDGVCEGIETYYNCPMDCKMLPSHAALGSKNLNLLSAEFTYECDGTRCYFDASASKSYFGEISSYCWEMDWGGGYGVCHEGPKTETVYPDLGTYSAKLIVTNDRGATETNKKAIVIEKASCGNGILEGDEECDDGNWEDWDGCSSDCRKQDLPKCGDNVINQDSELCDGTALGGKTCGDLKYDGGSLKCDSQCYYDTSSCTSSDPCFLNGDATSCTLKAEGCYWCWTQGKCQDESKACCGNGVLEGDEECDQWNNIEDGDGCSATCQVESGSSYCGNNKREGSELCDGTDLGGWSCTKVPEPFEAADYGTLKCSEGCWLDMSGCGYYYCGNGVKEGNEECDDGNNMAGDGCYQCKKEKAPVCGDGVANGVELCDGTDMGGLTCKNFNYKSGGTIKCKSDCTVDTSGCKAVCGNGVKEAGEMCDDGNTVSGDGCSSTCVSEGICGNGVLEGDEECDDHNTISGDGCSEKCVKEYCGDGIVQPGLGEECDDGNTNNGDKCSSTCLYEDNTVCPSIEGEFTKDGTITKETKCGWNDDCHYCPVDHMCRGKDFECVNEEVEIFKAKNFRLTNEDGSVTYETVKYGQPVWIRYEIEHVSDEWPIKEDGIKDLLVVTYRNTLIERDRIKGEDIHKTANRFGTSPFYTYYKGGVWFSQPELQKVTSSVEHVSIPWIVTPIYSGDEPEFCVFLHDMKVRVRDWQDNYIFGSPELQEIGCFDIKYDSNPSGMYTDFTITDTFSFPNFAEGPDEVNKISQAARALFTYCDAILGPVSIITIMQPMVMWVKLVAMGGTQFAAEGGFSEVGLPGDTVFGGHCYGMARAAIKYNEDESNKPVRKETIDMKLLDPGVYDDISIEFMHQASFPALVFTISKHMDKIVNKISDKEKWNSIYDDFVEGGRKPSLLAVPAHATTLFSVYDVSDTEKNFLVYDNNLPLETTVYNVDLSTGEWVSTHFSNAPTFLHTSNSYGGVMWIAPMKMPTEFTCLDLKDFIDTWVNNIIMPKLEDGNEIVIWLTDSLTDLGKTVYQSTIGSFFSPVNVRIIDSEGREMSADTKEIPGATFEVVDGETFYSVPTGIAYTVYFDGYADGEMGFDVFRDSSTASAKDVLTYDNIKITPETKGQFSVSADGRIYDIKVDNDGDGIADLSLSPNWQSAVQSVHVPFEVGIMDSEGRRLTTGVNEISGAGMEEFGGMKIFTIPAGTDYSLDFNQHANGDYKFYRITKGE